MPAADLVIPRYDHRSKQSKCVLLDCQCGRLRLSVPYDNIRVDPPPPPIQEKTESTHHAVVDCHCPQCRKYHVADRATYLLVPADKVEIQQMPVPDKGKSKRGETNSSSSKEKSTETPPTLVWSSFSDTCLHLGPVVRYQCAHCRTKLATQPKPPKKKEDDDDNNSDKSPSLRPYGEDQYFLNLAAARDDTLPKKWTKQWRAFRFPWEYNNQCVWTRATAENDDNNSSSSSSSDEEEEEEEEEKEDDVEEKGKNGKLGKRGDPYYITGGCACGTYRYQVKYKSLQSASTELQHCYCQLCRRLSGGPFQTWMPVRRSIFSWIPPDKKSSESAKSTESTSHEPPLHRYTSHGRRHVCDHCGGVLTIVYDVDGEDVIWPAAGGLDDSSLPKTKEEMSEHLYGVCHICCRFRQTWYALPNDGHSRISDAS